ncbi:MAG: hypothetical protein KC414_01295, partial [Romboutsia sp.]|nr:hypothetical protein [Romboutsia sp.]
MKNSSLRYSNNPVLTPLSDESVEFIKSYNKSINIDDKESLFLNFLIYVKNNFPTVKLAEYISACTCAYEPISPTNIFGAGNTYPPSVINCNDILNFSRNTPFYYSGNKGKVDGRFHVDYNNPIQKHEFIDKIINITNSVNLPYIFLDNARYFNANWNESTQCEKLLYKCYSRCNTKECLSKCDVELECIDSRLNDSIILDSSNSYKTIFINYINYFSELIRAINNSGSKCILNISVLPYTLNNKIEQNYWTQYKSFLRNNAVSFEQAWKGRHSPQYVLKELNVYEDLINNNSEIYLYPKYKNVLEGYWFASMAYIIGADNIKVFRSPYEKMPFWNNLPLFLGKSKSNYIFSTNCEECLNNRGGFEGDFIISNKFINANLIVGNLNISKNSPINTVLDRFRYLMNLNYSDNIKLVDLPSYINIFDMDNLIKQKEQNQRPFID